MTITDYVAALGAELPLRGRRRDRAVAEVTDHLHEAASDSQRAGMSRAEAEEQAIARFGPSRLVAARFGAELGTRAVRRTSALAVASGVALLALSVLLSSPPLRSAAPRIADGGPLLFIVVQLSAVACGLTLLRIVRFRSDETLAPAPLRLLLRGAGVSAGAAAVGAADVGFILVAHTTQPADSAWTLAVTVSVVVIAAIAAVCAVRVTREARLVRGYESVAASAGETGDVVDDLLAVGGSVVDRIQATAPWLARTLEGLLALVRRTGLRTHPWRFCVAFALTAAVVFTVAHGVADGEAIRLTPGPLLLAAFEALPIIALFAALGRFLAIRGD